MGETGEILRFGEFTLDVANRRLMRGGETVELGSRYFDALALLARHPNELVSKDRFMDEVWRGIPVTDEALTQGIRTLRRALADDASHPRFIETVPKHGYRFVAEVESAGQGRGDHRTTSPAPRIAGATTMGGVLAGVIGGVFYGAFATAGDVADIATILLLTTALALLGGAGIGTGMAMASLWRGERDWALVAGGSAGGALVGALGSALAMQGLQSLTGISPERVTGMFEGLALGLAASASVLLSFRLNLSRWLALSLAALLGALMAVVTALAGGRFYASTLAQLEQAFPTSRIDIGTLVTAAGPTGTAALEGAVFAAAVVLANLAWKKRSP